MSGRRKSPLRHSVEAPLAPDAVAQPRSGASPTASLRSRAVRGTLWASFDNVAQQGLSFLIFIVMANLLPPAAFGLIATSLVFIYFFRLTVFDSIAMAITVKENPTNRDYDTAFWINVGVAVALSCLLFAIADPVAALFGLPDLRDVIRGTSIILLFVGLSRTHEVWMRRNFRLKSLAIRNLCGVLAGGTVGILLAVNGYGVASLVAQQVVISLASLLLLWFVTPWRPRLALSRDTVAEIRAFGSQVAANGALTFATQSSDVFLITYLLGPHVSGIYNAAKRLVMAIQLSVWTPIAAVGMPTLSEIQSEPRRLATAMIDLSRVVATLVLPIFAGIAFLARDITLLLLGEEWQDAAPILTILCLSGVLTPLLGLNYQILLIRRRPARVTALTLLFIAIALLSLGLFAGYGPNAVAACFVAPFLVVLPLALVMVRHVIPLGIGSYLGAVLPPLVACGAMIGVLALLAPPLASAALHVRFAVLVGAGALAYLSVMAVVGRSTLRLLLSWTGAVHGMRA